LAQFWPRNGDLASIGVSAITRVSSPLLRPPIDEETPKPKDLDWEKAEIIEQNKIILNLFEGEIFEEEEDEENEDDEEE
jgi:hypothetical protein